MLRVVARYMACGPVWFAAKLKPVPSDNTHVAPSRHFSIRGIPCYHPRRHPETPLMPTNVPAGRDLRLDLFRGIALWLIFLDHIPFNVVNWVTIRNYGFSDAAEIFVFISGYTAAFVYGRAMRERGPIAAGVRNPLPGRPQVRLEPSGVPCRKMVFQSVRLAIPVRVRRLVRLGRGTAGR